MEVAFVFFYAGVAKIEEFPVDTQSTSHLENLEKILSYECLLFSNLKV